MVLKCKFSSWLKVPGKDVDLFVCFTHFPVYPSRERTSAFLELADGFDTFRDKGMLVFGGDFNSRCGMNGDEVVDTSGRQLLDFCSDHGFEIVNNLAICKGDFTRVRGCSALYD